jgi:hypothetical protein
MACFIRDETCPTRTQQAIWDRNLHCQNIASENSEAPLQDFLSRSNVRPGRDTFAHFSRLLAPDASAARSACARRSAN